MGTDYLEPGMVITAADLEVWKKKTGVTIGQGDVLLIRTGRWEMVRQKGEWDFMSRAAGSHALLAKWLKARDVAVIGCDGVSDVMPSGVEGLSNPLHEWCWSDWACPFLITSILDPLPRLRSNEVVTRFYLCERLYGCREAQARP